MQLVLARVVGHLARTLSEVDEDAAHVALVDAATVKGKALWELDACLTAHPDALIVGTSDCPPSLVRLAHVLQRAGHPVQPPKCSACGRSPDYLRAAPGGRLCSRCASRTSRIVRARCGRGGSCRCSPGGRRDLLHLLRQGPAGDRGVWQVRAQRPARRPASRRRLVVQELLYQAGPHLHRLWAAPADQDHPGRRSRLSVLLQASPPAPALRPLQPGATDLPARHRRQP